MLVALPNSRFSSILFASLVQCSAFPYAILGHSGGALAAKALADTLLDRNFGVKPVSLILSGCGWDTQSNHDYASLSESELTKLLAVWSDGVDVSNINLQALRNDLVLGSICAATYTAAVPYPSLVLTGTTDAAVPASTLPAWSKVLTGSHSFRELPGGHHALAAPSNFPFLATGLRDNLAALAAAGTLQVTEWNKAKTMDWPSNATLHEQFIDQAALTPDRVAVIDPATSPPKTLTYAELDSLSTLLAQYLYHTHAVRPGKSTGIFMERCWQFVVVYLAALKAGGAYMPLEVVYPKDLLTRVLESAEPACVVTKSSFMSKLKDGYPSFSVDGTDWIQTLEAMNLPPLPADTGARPDTMAYVVMSSGTTGTPKGICCPHRGAVHSYWFRRVSNPWSPETDVEACNVFFVWECLRSLLVGAKMLVIPDEIVYDPTALTNLMEEYKVTRIQVSSERTAHSEPVVLCARFVPPPLVHTHASPVHAFPALAHHVVAPGRRAQAQAALVQVRQPVRRGGDEEDGGEVQQALPRDQAGQLVLHFGVSRRGAVHLVRPGQRAVRPEPLAQVRRRRQGHPQHQHPRPRRGSEGMPCGRVRRGLRVRTLHRDWLPQ